jgi:hypothetical protein
MISHGRWVVAKGMFMPRRAASMKPHPMSAHVASTASQCTSQMLVSQDCCLAVIWHAARDAISCFHDKGCKVMRLAVD